MSTLSKLGWIKNRNTDTFCEGSSLGQREIADTDKNIRPKRKISKSELLRAVISRR